MVLAALGWLGLAATPALAQVQRSFVNPSFEKPRINVDSATGCYRNVPAFWVPGWASTEAVGNTFNNSCPVGTWVPPTGWDGINPVQPAGQYVPLQSTPATQNMIQLFRQTSGGVNAVEGSQWAELNADSNARLYQRVCMASGEQIDWSLSHRARANTVNPEVMEFNIGSSNDGAGSTLIVRGSEITDGSQGTPTAAAPARLCPTTVGGNPATCTYSVNSATGWVTYQGRFTWSGSSDESIGFQAIYGSNGSVNGGNYLDNVKLTLKPFLQFSTATTTYTEGGTQPTVGLHIVGDVPTTFTVTLVVSGTATGAGSDYTLTNATITIPAADYGEGQTFNAPLTFVNDAVIENNETLILTIPASTSSSPYVLASTTACGITPNSSITVTIIDNDVDLSTTKSVSTAAPLYGTPFTYTVTYRNNTGTPTIAPLTSHDVTAAISDPVPSGLTFTSWTCAGTGGGTCPAASGSGAISGNADLPAGSSVTYQVTATLAGHTCAAISNVSTITTPAGFTESSAVQSGFSNPATPGGATNNSASVSVTPQCTDLRITKTNTPASGVNDQASDTVSSGANTTYSLVVTNTGPAVTGAIVTDQPNAAGLTCPATGTVSCTGSACLAASYPASTLTGTGITLGTLPTNGSATLTLICQVY